MPRPRGGEEANAALAVGLERSQSAAKVPILNLIRGYELPHQNGSAGFSGIRTKQNFVRGLVKAYMGKMLSDLKERSFNGILAELELDKAFASAWLDNTRVLVGSKCNRLICINTESGEVEEIKLPKLNRKDAVFGTPSFGAGCGIRSISVNPSKNTVASSSSNPCHLTVLEIPTFKPVSTFVGHSDWIFGTAWIDDVRVITASRDATLRIWNVNNRTGTQTETSEAVCSSLHKHKVRDVKYDRSCALAASVSTDGMITFWDPATIGVVRSVRLKPDQSKELACIAIEQGLMAAGSLYNISLMDIRSKDIKSIKSKGLGTRSLSFHEGTLTIGGGCGKISFFDLRMDRFLEVSSDSPPDKERSFHLQTSQGLWHPRDMQFYNFQQHTGIFAQSELFSDVIQSHQFMPSCFTHCWDPLGVRLFVGGGPSFQLARGCYMSVWS